MTRRAIPLTFFVCVLPIVVLLLTITVMASKAGVRVPNVRGHLDGFFLGADNAVGLVRSDITQQFGRRITGDGHLLDTTTGNRLAVFNFSGALAADDVIRGTGKTPTGRFALQSSVEFFAGHKGTAGVMDAQLQFLPRQGDASQVAALLLQPFPDTHATNISGNGAGTCKSDVDPTFEGDIVLQFLTHDRNAFPGSVTCVPRAGTIAPFSWQCRATVSDQGRLILIAQGKSGRMIVIGTVSPISVTTLDEGIVETESTSRAIDALYSLQFHDGRTDMGRFNFSLITRSP